MKMNDKSIKGIIIIAIVIIIFAALSRTLGGAETLSEYADKHPEQQVTIEENEK